MNSTIEEIRRLAQLNLDAQKIPPERLELQKLEFGRHALQFATMSELSIYDHTEITKKMTTPQTDDYWVEYFTGLHELDDERLESLHYLEGYIFDKTTETFEINGETIKSGERRRVRTLAITVAIRDSSRDDSRIHSLAEEIIEMSSTEAELTAAARYEISKLRDIKRRPKHSSADLVPDGTTLTTIHSSLL